MLPQLISRICHEQQSTLRLLKSLLALVMKHYPEQVLWQFAFVHRSKQQNRASDRPATRPIGLTPVPWTQAPVACFAAFTAIGMEG